MPTVAAQLHDSIKHCQQTLDTAIIKKKNTVLL